MPVSWGGMRGIGRITIRILIQINPGKKKGRHKPTWQHGKGSIREKMKMQVQMCTWGGGRGVRWTRTWWMEEMPPSPPYTWGCVGKGKHQNIKTSWRESPEFHRTPSLPRRSHRHCQACSRVHRGVHASPEAQWEKVGNGTWNCMWQGGWRYYFKARLAAKFQPFGQNGLGKASNVAVYRNLYPTDRVIPWIPWTQIWSEALGFHTCKGVLFQWKLFFLSQKW